jgi:hypothetical protein
MRFPGCFDLIKVFLNDFQCGVQTMLRQTVVRRQFNTRLQPELRFAGGMLYVNMCPAFLA